MSGTTTSRFAIVCFVIERASVRIFRLNHAVFDTFNMKLARVSIAESRQHEICDY